jgi:flagellar hook assembly protein FlgD
LRVTLNPFRSRTELRFGLRRAQPVQLTIYDPAGRRVVTLIDGPLPAGSHTRAWDGRDAAGRPRSAGVYFVRLRSAEQDAVRRLILLH